MVSPSNCRCEPLVWNLFPVTLQYKIKSKIAFQSSLQLLSASPYCISAVTHFSFLFSKMVSSIVISEPHYFLHSIHYNSFVLYILMKFCFVKKVYTQCFSELCVDETFNAHTYISTHVNISISRLLVYSQEPNKY